MWWRLRVPPQAAAFLDDWANAMARATAFDKKLTSDALTVMPKSSDYADILALSVRQLFGTIELTSGFDGTTHVESDIMAFMRGTLFVSAKFLNPA